MHTPIRWLALAPLVLSGCVGTLRQPPTKVSLQRAMANRPSLISSAAFIAGENRPASFAAHTEIEKSTGSEDGDSEDPGVVQVAAVSPSADEAAEDSEELVPPAPSDREAEIESKVSLRHMTKAELPIDLITVIRLVDTNSPNVGVSLAKLREAYARAEAADVLWLPNFSIGTAYNRYDGQTQNQRGEIFAVSRGNLFGSSGLSLTLDTSEAHYRPLIEWRVASSEQHKTVATLINMELEAVLAYIDLLQVHEMLNVNLDTLEKGEALLDAARNAQQANLDRSAGDVNRVRTEVLLRRQERTDLSGRSAAASARLGRLLLLDPSVRLVPQFAETIPITIIDPEMPLEDLLFIAANQREELAAIQDQIVAATERARKAEYGPLFPKLQVANQVGSFGGGLDGILGDFYGRSTVSAMVYWEVRNLGQGNMAETREREAAVDQFTLQAAELQARVAAEVVEAAEVALAKSESLKFARDAVAEALELYRISHEGTFNVVDTKNLFDALRPLQALQFLNQARQNYISAVMDYNRAQYRLNAALGAPSRDASENRDAPKLPE